MFAKRVPRSRVHLHVHLDGAMRPETLWDIAKRRGKTEEDLETFTRKCQVQDEGDLNDFLATFTFFMPFVVGDREAITRIAKEFCEDSAAQDVAYTEVRYCPHLFSNSQETRDYGVEKGTFTPEEAVRAVNEGLQEGSKLYNVKVNTILCCMRHRPEWSAEVVELCEKFRKEGVVAIDLAGGEPCITQVPTDQRHLAAFEEAKRRGLNVTLHAGEGSSHHNVIEAVNVIGASRVGHGYHLLRCEDSYQSLRQQNVHFEVCPVSSKLTKSIPGDISDHPLKRFAADDVNFSISTDDPGVTGKTLDHEYEICIKEHGLTLKNILQCNLNAAMAAFMSDNDRVRLVQRFIHLYQSEYGVTNFSRVADFLWTKAGMDVGGCPE